MHISQTNKAYNSPLWGRCPEGTERGCVILANGSFPTAELPLRMLREAPCLVCCDGAARWVDDCDAVVGDGDSLPAELKERYKDRFIHIAEQDDNDLTKATRHCMSLGHKKILYLGATGKREDHTLGNISLMVEYMRNYGIEPLMMTDHGIFMPHHGNGTFSSFKGQQVSIFNFGCTCLSAKNLLYPLRPFTNWWQGTLNESLADVFSITADGDYLVYQAFQR